MDKNQAIIDYLRGCSTLTNNPLFFNFANVEDEHTQILIKSSSKNLNRQYIDGSVQKQFTFTIFNFKSISYNPLVTVPGISNENIEELSDIQDIIDWISEQNDLRNFPDFGEDCIVDSISTTTENPELQGVDKTVSPAIAVYGVSIVVEYLDTSKKIWQY